MNHLHNFVLIVQISVSKVDESGDKIYANKPANLQEGTSNINLKIILMGHFK